MGPIRSLDVLMPRIEGLIFDFDGVLVDSDPLHAEAYRIAFERQGIALTERDYVERAKGLGRSEVVALFGESLSPAARVAVSRAKTLEAERMIRAGGLEPVAAVVPFIRSARDRGLLCAVASTSEIAGLAVERLDMKPLFDSICAKRSEDRPKPHPDVFVRAMAGLRLAPERCLIVEDTPVGVRAARAAGAPVIVRGAAARWAADPLARDVLAFFEDYRALHRMLGWGPLAGVDA